MARRTLVAIALSILIGEAVWLANRPPTVSCEGAADPAAHEFRAVAVVARPWLGPHHVYGLFIVPELFASRAFVETLQVREYEERFARNRFPKPRQIADVVAPTGHYVERVFVPTRAASRLFVTGRFGDLRTACNWTLTFSSRTSPSVPAD